MTAPHCDHAARHGDRAPAARPLDKPGALDPPDASPALGDGPGACPGGGVALEPMPPEAGAQPNRELTDMTRRFWIGLTLTAPVFVMEMGQHAFGLHGALLGQRHRQRAATARRQDMRQSMQRERAMKFWLAAPAALIVFTAAPALAQHTHDHGAHEQQAPAAPAAHAHDAAPEQPAADDSHAGMRQEAPMDHATMMASMTGLQGAYAMSRDASGTAWQPDTSSHGGVHLHQGDWMLMGHAMLNAVYDWQEGPRGDEKTFLAGMIMGSARRDVGASGTLNLRAMASPDPLMGDDGYPLLFAAGETADGVNPLVDRQHPHDLFMELSASYAHQLTRTDSVFVYAGLPGEPAFGPPAFMHRMAAMDSPEAPITHHWFDSTHITFGVVTAGWVHDNVKLEASRFRGREPDQDRYDIESGELDSTSVRATWNPTANLSLQASWADIASPEALEPDQDEERWSASGLYTRDLGAGAWWSTTLAFASKERSDGVSLDAWLGEAALHPNDSWTLFARGERVETDELEGGGHGRVTTVSRLSLGAIRDWRINDATVLGVGALAQRHFASDDLEPLYAGDPAGAMAFVRLKIG